MGDDPVPVSVVFPELIFEVLPPEAGIGAKIGEVLRQGDLAVPVIIQVVKPFLPGFLDLLPGGGAGPSRDEAGRQENHRGRQEDKNLQGLTHLCLISRCCEISATVNFAVILREPSDRRISPIRDPSLRSG